MSRDESTDQLLELAVTNLGVIAELGLVFERGMTAITGETGAGKTLVLTALQLLVGGRADPSVVGPRADEAVVEGRFVVNGDELVLRRVVPRSGRSRAYVNGNLATAGALAEIGDRAVEVHGQHGHTALTRAAEQRVALDVFAGIDSETLAEARRALRELIRKRDELGDERGRLRQIELLRHQVDEIEAAAIVDDEEDSRLYAQEQLLADATAHQEALHRVLELLAGDGPAEAALGQALSALDGREPFVQLASRLRDLTAELADVVVDIRTAAEQAEADPERLAAVQERRRVIAELRRKYGETLAEVRGFHDDAMTRLGQLEDRDRLAAEIDEHIAAAEGRLERAATKVLRARRRAAPELAEAVTAHLRRLALPNARLEVGVGGDAGDDVEIRVSMNSGAPLQPLAKIASGGELARTMLALRLVLSATSPTMVFDEVDAGIGGAAAHSVGAALARLGNTGQVLVVTHLAQVAAFADHQVSVVKSDDGDVAAVEASSLDGDARVVELSRMLSGSPESGAARDHAAELLADAITAKAG